MNKYHSVVAVIVGGAAECADQLGYFEVHCVGISFEIGSEGTASGYEELYPHYRDDVSGYTTDEGEHV